MQKISQGKRANLNGRILEDQVIARIKSEGYIEVDKKMQTCLNLDNHSALAEGKYFIRQFRICDSIYGNPYHTDILLLNNVFSRKKLAIDIKWQQISGSVDEKFPYLVENIKTKFPCPAILILDGKGYKIGAWKWLKGQIDDKLIGVYNLSEFITWVNSGRLEYL